MTSTAPAVPASIPDAAGLPSALFTAECALAVARISPTRGCHAAGLVDRMLAWRLADLPVNAAA